MSMASATPRVRPSAWWYALVAVLWIAAGVIFGLFVIKPVADLVEAGTTGFDSGDSIAIGDAGLTVYTSDLGASPTCTLTADDGTAIDMDTFDDGTYSYDFGDGPEMEAAANTPDDLPAGNYIIECDTSEGQLAFGDRIDVDDLAKKFAVGFLAPLVLGIAGLVILIVMLVKRHNSKSRIRAEKVQAAEGGWPPPPGYGPPASDDGQPSGSYPPAATLPPPPHAGRPAREDPDDPERR